MNHDPFPRSWTVQNSKIGHFTYFEKMEKWQDEDGEIHIRENFVRTTLFEV